MCRINGLFLLIKINKQTARAEQPCFCHGSYIYAMRVLTVRNSAICPYNDNRLLIFCVIQHVADIQG